VARYSRQLVVAVPVDEAFDYLSRFSSVVEWDPSVSSARMLTPEPVQQGSAFALDVVFMGRTLPLRYEITEFDRPHRVVLAAENASVRSTDAITVSRDLSGATVIDYSADLALKGLARLAAPVFALALRRIGGRAAEGLLAVLAGRASRPRP